MVSLLNHKYNPKRVGAELEAHPEFNPHLFFKNESHGELAEPQEQSQKNMTLSLKRINEASSVGATNCN